MSSDWVNELFSRSLDIFAKVLPGLIVIFALVISLSSIEEAYRRISCLSQGEWFAVIVIAWIVGYAVQSIGEFTHLIRYHPKCVTTEEWYKQMAKFRSSNTYEAYKLAFYRLGLVKEACDNTYVALILAIVWIVVSSAMECNLAQIRLTNINADERRILVFIVFLILSLRRMHHVNVDRQYKYLQASLTLEGKAAQREVEQ